MMLPSVLSTVLTGPLHKWNMSCKPQEQEAQSKWLSGLGLPVWGTKQCYCERPTTL